MYYGVDENGNIIASYSSDILPDVYQEVFPSLYSDFQLDPDLDLDLDDNIVTVSGSDLFYNDFYDLLANIPGYNVYPNTNAINVFSYVLNGLQGGYGYVILSGSDTNSTYLYYSRLFDISGNNITLKSPVTFCNYSSYRPSNNSNYIYTYNVSQVGDTSFNITNQLVYTNLLDGYPDLISYKSKESYSLIFIIAFSILLLFFAIIRNSKRGL